MATKKESNGNPNKLAVYEKIVASNPAIERKGDTIPYTSLNGNIFSLLGKDGSLGFRLSEEDRESFLKKYPSAILVQYGAVMKEYVKIPDVLLTNTKELKKYFDLSYEYVKSLKPKPTAKTKTAKKKK
jgi:TfoX/Sxy family transcriptional regulator of competence genes